MRRLLADSAGIAAAAELLIAGEVVAIPTETVYGLAALADLPPAVAKVFAAKGRPAHNPLIVHVADTAAATRLVRFDARAHKVAASFWPGPITLVLPHHTHTNIAGSVTAGLSTLAVRVPSHPVALALLARVGRPVAAPSANLSGRVSPTQAAHVAEALNIAAVLEGGPSKVGLESTILDLSGEVPVLLRPGAITQEAVEALLGPIARSDGDPTRPTAPGQLLRHYAPQTPLRINAETCAPGEGWLAFGGWAPPEAAAVRHLSVAGDLAEAAANLFAALRELDALGLPGLAAAPVPERGVGVAINERLRRAAAGSLGPDVSGG